MMNKENVLYSKTNEWVYKKDNNIVLVGISSYATMHLGDLQLLDLKEVGTVLNKGDVFGNFESIKQTGDLYLPVSGKITKINDSALADLSKITDFPFDTWLVEVELSNQNELDELMNVSDYENQLD